MSHRIALNGASLVEWEARAWLDKQIKHNRHNSRMTERLRCIRRLAFGEEQ